MSSAVTHIQHCVSGYEKLGCVGTDAEELVNLFSSAIC